MFDVPSMLGEYLLPLLIVVPLAVVVLVIASRSSGDDASQRPAPPPWTPPVAPPVAPSVVPSPAHPPAVPPLQASAEPLAVPYPVTVPASPFVEPLDLVLPDEPAMTVAPPPTEAAAPVAVLVVDDSAVVRTKLSKLLAGAGYAVTLARHGHEALEQLGQHRFAVMITDLEMPEMDGFELIAQVSNDLRTEDLPIIAITGHEALQAKVQDARGLFGIFKKPWNDRELLARVAVLASLRAR